MAKMPNAELRVIPSTWGHIAAMPSMSPEEGLIGEAVEELLGQPGGIA